jgi:predicted patatin/cPLA2 family phospholipase
MEWDEHAQLEAERLERTINALDEIYGLGMYETAEFLAVELGVKRFWKPHKENAWQR